MTTWKEAEDEFGNVSEEDAAEQENIKKKNKLIGISIIFCVLFVVIIIVVVAIATACSPNVIRNNLNM